MAKLENEYQSKLKKKIESRFPGSYVLKNDPSFFQGIPDLVVLHSSGKWATLECKKDSAASHRPNQDYYVEDMNSKAYSSFIFPENEEEVLNAMEQAFED